MNTYRKEFNIVTNVSCTWDGECTIINSEVLAGKNVGIKGESSVSQDPC